MKNLLLLGLFTLLSASALHAANQGETTLYSSRGDAQAYIDYPGGMTIYLWSGDPVAYLDQKEGGIFNVWGFNGRHLGWFSDGILRDEKGYVVGAIKETYNGTVNAEPAKMAKRTPPPKARQEISPFPPRPSMDWSKQGNIRTFLLQGKYD